MGPVVIGVVLTAIDAAEIHASLVTTLENIQYDHYSDDATEIENEARMLHIKGLLERIGPDGVNLL